MCKYPAWVRGCSRHRRNSDAAEPQVEEAPSGGLLLLTPIERHSFRGAHYHSRWNSARRSLLCVWVLPVLACAFVPHLARNHIFSVTMVAVCAFAVLLNFPQLTNKPLRAPVRFETISAHPRARKMFTAISVVLLPIYLALLFDVVLTQYGEMGQFTRMPLVFQVIIVFVTLTKCLALHKQVSAVLVKVVLWVEGAPPAPSVPSDPSAPAVVRVQLPTASA